ncbi:MAG TPA: formylglycine-generating enzyme family protein [Dehalococcoidia bacterium]|nr:formylglycine-generating enzyme family protein [Dehalococcoidia bacterium]
MTTVQDIETVLIPAGPFGMGADNGRPDERPVHRVTLSALRMAVLPVTNEDYAAFLSVTGHERPRFWDDTAFSGPRQPVVGVSWYDAVAYCDWLSGVHGMRFRLPTEAEWEKAALGGVDGAKYPWGDEPFNGEGGRFKQEATWEVGAAPPNGYGLIDIGFNVHEWCSDWYDPAYYAVSPEHDPQGPPSGARAAPHLPERKASRGGAWRHAVKVSRCAARSSIPPEYRYNDYGFRVVQVVDS